MNDVSEKPRRDAVGEKFPEKLLTGYNHFKDNRLVRERERYQELAETGQKPEVMIIASALEIQDPRERPVDKQKAADEL